MAASNSENEFPFNSDREYELRLGNSFHSRGAPKTAFHTVRCKTGSLCFIKLLQFSCCIPLYCNLAAVFLSISAVKNTAVYNTLYAFCEIHTQS